jgi:uncharacterized protein YbjT (DUF2867 family)
MLRVCLTGATGFIGSNLLDHLKDRQDLEIAALSRSMPPIMDGARKGNVIWKRCDGFSLLDAENALERVDILIYLIHSMQPSTSLTQGHFSDFDLYLADNFARAAQKQGVQKIIYLGGLIPKTKDLSSHLKSRLEVEKALANYGNNVTSLRAGLIVGKNGSSFRILERLSKRLPVSICPSWTLSLTQPIDLQDVLVTLEYCIDNYKKLKTQYDIGGPDVITYKDMLLMTAEVLKMKRYIINVPLLSPKLSRLWVSKVTSTSRNLVYPLVESLVHDMVADPERQLLIDGHNYTPFKRSLRNGLDKKPESWIRAIINYNMNLNFRWLKNATSMQRVQLNQNLSAVDIAQEYFTWIPWFLVPVVQVKFTHSENSDLLVTFTLFYKIPLLILQKCEQRSDSHRCLYYIRGGVLARESTLNGRFEFRLVGKTRTLLMALLNYRPSLPWFIYKYTQAIIHLYVMKSFARHLRSKQ